MNDLQEFEARLQAALVDAERRIVEPTGLAERLIAGRATRTATVIPLRRRSQKPWIAPLLAAAVVAAAVTGSLLVVDAGHHSAPAIHLTPDPSPTPTQSAVPTLSPSPTPTPTRSVISPSPTRNQIGPVGVAVPHGFLVYSTSFVSPQVGWALGNAPCPKPDGYCATLLRTTNGGQSWRSVPVPTGITPVDDQGSSTSNSCGDNGGIAGPCVDVVTFADDRIGYLSGFSSLFMTTDGGASWTNLNRRASSLVVSGGRVITWSYVAECSAGCPGRLDTAPLGSNSWTEIEPGGYVSTLFGSGLVHAGPYAYFFSYPQSAATSLTAVGVAVFRSADGGRTWLRRSVGATCAGARSSSGAPDGTLALNCLVGVDSTSTGVSVSTDGGVTFHSWVNLPSEGVPASQPFALESAVAAASADNVIDDVFDFAASPYTDHLYRASGAASAWAGAGAFTRPRNDQTSPVAVFVTSNFGVINRGPGVSTLITTDGGRTWAAITYH